MLSFSLDEKMANLVQIGKVRLVLRSEEFTSNVTNYILGFCLSRRGRATMGRKEVVSSRNNLSWAGVKIYLFSVRMIIGRSIF